MTFKLKNGHILYTPGGHIARGDGCCCGCCVRDPWPTLYLTLDNFEIDLPLQDFTGADVTPPDAGANGSCAFFCSQDELNDVAAASWSAIPSTGNLSWTIPDPFSGDSSTWPDAPNADGVDSCYSLIISPECVQYQDGIWRYRLNYGRPVNPAPVFGNADWPCGQFPLATNIKKWMLCDSANFRRCMFYPTQNGHPLDATEVHPILGVAGAACNPFYLQAVIEGVFLRWGDVFNQQPGNNLTNGCCFGLGRFRMTITE